MRKVSAVAIAVWIGILSLSSPAVAASRELIFRSSDLPALISQIFPANSVQPPFKIEVWVQSLYGLEAEGEKTRLKDCLRQQLRAPGRRPICGLSQLVAYRVVTQNESMVHQARKA